MINPNTTAPESIVVSLENAKLLKAAGWAQEPSVFYWQWFEDDREWPNWDGNSAWYCDQMHVGLDDYDDGECYAAATAEEILWKLPKVLHIGEKREAVYLSIKMDSNKWIVLYSPDYDQRRCNKENFWKQSKTSLSDALSSMYCHLAEHKLLPSL